MHVAAPVVPAERLAQHEVVLVGGGIIGLSIEIVANEDVYSDTFPQAASMSSGSTGWILTVLLLQQNDVDVCQISEMNEIRVAIGEGSTTVGLVPNVWLLWFPSFSIKIDLIQ